MEISSVLVLVRPTGPVLYCTVLYLRTGLGTEPGRVGEMAWVGRVII